jgi:hypothetical protein
MLMILAITFKQPIHQSIRMVRLSGDKDIHCLITGRKKKKEKKVEYVCYGWPLAWLQTNLTYNELYCFVISASPETGDWSHLALRCS